MIIPPSNVTKEGGLDQVRQRGRRVFEVGTPVGQVGDRQERGLSEHTAEGVADSELGETAGSR
jgi:hypothetical protein